MPVTASRSVSAAICGALSYGSLVIVAANIGLFWRAAGLSGHAVAGDRQRAAPVLVQLPAPTSSATAPARTGGSSAPPLGGILQDSAYSADWAAARAAALTPAQHASPLARRPYDLRHAAVSLWLNSGVPATEADRRAGHSVAVLLKIYAHCIDGQADAANKRIADALGSTGDSQDDQEP